MRIAREDIPKVNPARVAQLMKGTVLVRWIDPSKSCMVGKLYLPPSSKDEASVFAPEVELLKIAADTEFALDNVAPGKRYLRSEKYESHLVFRHGEGDDESLYFIDDSEAILCEVSL